MVAACEGALIQGSQEDIISQFWPVWLELEAQLYRICLPLMNWNVTEAEDALSQAKIKAWEKVQKHADKIINLRAWLMQLTINLCKDILDKRSRGPAAVEDIEWVGDDGALCTASSMPSPEKVLETEEKSEQIRRAVASLPQRLRDTFILHFYEGLKHKEIVERLGISYDNVCKRISLARKQLKTSLRGYFLDEEDPATAWESAQQKSPTSVAQVEKQKIQLPEEKRKETATVSAGKDSVPVVVEAKPELVSCAVDPNAIVGCEMKEVADRGSGPLSEPTPQAIVDKQNILSDDSQGNVTASVSAAKEWAPVAVEEKLEYVTGVVPTTVLVEQKLSEVCTQLEERSVTPVGVWSKPVDRSGGPPSRRIPPNPPLLGGFRNPPLLEGGVWGGSSPTTFDHTPPVGSGEKLLSRAGQKPGFFEYFSPRDRDIPRNPVSQGPPDRGNGSARSPGRTAIVEKLTIQFSGAVALGALLYRKIKEVCGHRKARSRDRSPPARVEKLPILFASEGSKEAVTVPVVRGVDLIFASPNPKGSGYMNKARLRGLDYKSAVYPARGVDLIFASPNPKGSGYMNKAHLRGLDYKSAVYPTRESLPEDKGCLWAPKSAIANRSPLAAIRSGPRQYFSVREKGEGRRENPSVSTPCAHNSPTPLPTPHSPLPPRNLLQNLRSIGAPSTPPNSELLPSRCPSPNRKKNSETGCGNRLYYRIKQPRNLQLKEGTPRISRDEISPRIRV